MANYLNILKQTRIEVLNGLGWSMRRVAKETGMDRRTVSKYLEISRQGLVPVQNLLPAKSEEGIAVPTSSPLIKPFVDTVTLKFMAGLSARRIYQDLLEYTAFKGSYSCVSRYVKKLRKKGKTWFPRLESLPGSEAQVDYGTGPKVLYRGKLRKTWVFSMLLSYSRHTYSELVFDQSVESFIRSHERAYRFFGGIPRSVKIDNLKAGVLHPHLFEPDLNPVYAAFCRHWKVVPLPCTPYKPQEKGKVERFIRYVKDNALKGRQFDSLQKGNRFLEEWNKAWACKRQHPNKIRTVQQMFCDVEASTLGDLPSRNFKIFQHGARVVDITGYITVENNYYSVPHELIKEKVRIHYDSKKIEVFFKDSLVCEHAAISGKGRYISNPKHIPSWKPASREDWERQQLRRAKNIGVSFEEYVSSVLEEPGPLAIRMCRGVMSLINSVSDEELDVAALRVLASGAKPSYRKLRAECFSDA